MKKGTKKRKPNINGLSSIEAEIMQIVWDRDKVTVREVHEELLKAGYIPYTTIMAAMNNLAQKGVLKQNRNGKAYIYSAAVSQTQVANEIIDNVVERVLNGSPDTILRHLLKLKSEDEVEALKKLKEKLQ